VRRQNRKIKLSKAVEEYMRQEQRRKQKRLLFAQLRANGVGRFTGRDRPRIGMSHDG